jgi:hypothetical protein
MGSYWDNVQAFFASDKRYRNALVGGVVGGVAGAVWTVMDAASLAERLFVVALVAAGLAIAMILLLGGRDEED